jgi:PAS domain S-box-containing protein
MNNSTLELEQLFHRLRLLEEENQQLKAENKKFFSAVENSPATIVITDKHGNIEYANPGFTQITGYSPQEAFGQNAKILKSGLHDNSFYKHLWQTINAGEVWQGEFHNRKKNGDFYWEQAHIAPIKNSEGTITHFVAIKFDITQKKENGQYLETIINAIPDLIFVVDQDGRFVDIMASNTILLRQARRRLKNKLIQEVFPEQIAVKLSDFVENTIKYNSKQIIEYKIELSSDIQWFEGSSASLGIEVAGKKCIVIAARDITYRKKTEQTLKVLNTTKDKFFTILAHDLKNPFGAILTFSGMLLESIANNELDETVQIGKLINSSAHHTYNLLENLLDWARSQTGKLIFDPTKLMLHEIVDSTIHILESQALGKQVILVNKVPENIEVYADSNLLKTIIRNLVGNAIKFTGPTGKINVSTHRNDESIEIIVSDTGIGIHPDIQEKLFQMDSRYISRGTADETGTGLGLLLCKEFVEKHGGTIWVESELGKGSKFKFTIPS